MLESKKVRDRLEEEETFGLEREKSSYLDRLPLYLSRVMFSFRARAIKGVKHNTILCLELVRFLVCHSSR